MRVMPPVQYFHLGTNVQLFEQKTVLTEISIGNKLHVFESRSGICRRLK